MPRPNSKPSTPTKKRENARILLVKYVMAAFLMLHLCMLVVLTFLVPNLVSLIMDEGAIHFKGLRDAIIANSDKVDHIIVTIELVTLGLIAMWMFLHVFFIFGTIKTNFPILVIYAVFQSMGTLLTLPLLAVAPLMVYEIVLQIIPTILACYLIRLLMDELNRSKQGV